ncbi:MAG: iron-sulfur cluster assembly scaffold protein [Steroidobacteraceae bacterium]
MRPPQAASPLCALAWDHFIHSPHAGDLPPGEGAVVTGEAGRITGECWVRLQVRHDAGHVTAARFRSFACPHTVATCDWLCAQLDGRPIADLQPSAPAEWAAALCVPREKLGELLLVEDALRSIAAQLGVHRVK